MTTEERLKRIEGKLDRINEKLNVLTKLEAIQMSGIDDILTEVAELPTINDSLDALFAQLQELIKAGGTDPVKLQQALELITTQKARTKAAIVANTPASTPTP
jgi:predicted component of type VI protein secretion system